PQDAGGRALRGFVRPYARATAGEPLSMRFDRKSGTFAFAYAPDPAVSSPTEIFVPALQYPAGYRVCVQGGEVERSGDGSILRVRASAGANSTAAGADRVEVRIERI
ncbi:MAG: hypothetical protein Q8M76_13765, partial [Spirochaetaceae bacterium]|nr:hypothetical protein [Spirochaetaceae bacterium]